MKRKAAGFGFLTVFCLIAIGALVLGCGDDDPTSSVTTADPPEVPPISTFAMDFGHFGLDYGGAERADAPEMSLASANWRHAAGTVGQWNVIIALHLAVPVAAFAESFRHEAVLQPDGWWQWSYNFSVLTVTYTARLQGRITLSGLEWRMYISKHGEYTDFLWFTGHSDLDRQGFEGAWLINRNPATPEQYIQIDWYREALPDTTGIVPGISWVKYTNVIPQDPDSGAYIKYTVHGEQGLANPYDRVYEVHGESSGIQVDIEWSHETKAGRVRDNMHYGVLDWQCWDEALENIDCPVFQ